MVAQILEGLVALHKAKIIHRDIKPDNIMIDDTKSDPIVTIIDVGLAVDIESTKDPGFAGTIEYIAPEVANRENYDTGVDIWALGVTIAEMQLGQNPFTLYKEALNKDTLKVLSKEELDTEVEEYIKNGQPPPDVNLAKSRSGISV